MADMTTDILSSLSQNGSGIQLKSLTSSLVEAETNGERVLTERRIEDANTSISAMGLLSSQLGLFKAGMESTAESASRVASSTTNAVSLEVTMEALASDISAVVEVNTLAASQVLSINFDTNTNTSTLLGASSFSLSTANTANPLTIDIDNSNNTLTGFTRTLNSIEGLSASLINTGDSMALIIKSDAGVANALDATSIAGIKEALGLTADGTEGQNDPTHNPLGLTSGLVAATDANFTIDGVNVTRDSNVVEDLFPGHRMTLNKVGTSTLVSNESNTSVRDRITTFLDEVNSLKDYLKTATQRGFNGAEEGALAGDIAAQSILNKMGSITTQPISGFGDKPFYLAELGIKTELDGRLTLDEARFESAIENNPEIAEALFATQYSTDEPGVGVTGLSFAPPKAGSYALVFDPSTTPPTATLDGQDLDISTDLNGKTTLRSPSGDTNGMLITLENAQAVSTNVRYGVSLTENLETYSDALIGAGGLLSRRETELNEDLLNFEKDMTTIEARVDVLTDRYNTQFGRMEAMIASLNETGEYMESLVESWNQDN
jgi:flagellar hook-associated protein 2